MVDRPQHGRSPFNPEFQGPMAYPAPTHFLERLFTRPRDFEDNYPQARLHTQWPGDGTMADPAFRTFLAGTGPTLSDHAQSQRDAQRAGAQLLDRIGPVILLTHSAGGPPGWLIADARPELAKAIVAVEPLGPPFEAISGPLPYGVTHAPLAFDPPLADGDRLASEDQPSPAEGLIAYTIQAEPARALPNLSMPITVVTAEASWMARRQSRHRPFPAPGRVRCRAYAAGGSRHPRQWPRHATRSQQRRGCRCDRTADPANG